jgi:LPXTG-motif cell wall-anchored protein
MIHAKDPSNLKGNGIWHFNLGGKVYSVCGSEDTTYTLANAPAGTYLATAQFVTDGSPNVLQSATITVPTVTGGQLPNTAAPWYNYLVIGLLLMVIGTLFWRKRKLHE